MELNEQVARWLHKWEYDGEDCWNIAHEAGKELFIHDAEELVALIRKELEAGTLKAVGRWLKKQESFDAFGGYIVIYPKALESFLRGEMPFNATQGKPGETPGDKTAREPKGNYLAARGIAPGNPGADLPEVIIRRMRGEDKE